MAVIRRHYSGTPRPSRNRKHVCRECHAPATHVEIETRMAGTLKRDGTIIQFVEPVAVYWCDAHSGMKARPL